MDTDKLIVFGAVSFLMSIVSAIGGGGGGFILTPLAIFLGLTPQQAIATGKIGGLATTLGSLQELRRAKVHHWRSVLPLMALATAVGLISPFIIKNIDNDIYQRIIGVLLILLVPVVWYKKVGTVEHRTSAWQKALGYIVLLITLLMAAIFSSGLGVLVVLTLMGLMGMKALEANVTKRYSQVILNSLLVLGLVGSHLIVWKVAAVVAVTNASGAVIGSKMALKRGDEFITKVFVVLMLISGLALVFGNF
jgi:uncharacterized membrane protein YfcA